jgi:hypothetical protein
MLTASVRLFIALEAPELNCEHADRLSSRTIRQLDPRQAVP